MAVNLSPSFNETQLKSDGTLAVGYKVWSFAQGSTAPLSTFTTSAGNVAQSNPIILNARGEVDNLIWLTAGLGYKLVLTDNSGDNITIGTNVTIRTEDNLKGVNDSSSTVDQWVASGLTPTYISATSFTLSGDQTSNFHVGRQLKSSVTAGTAYSEIISTIFTTLTTVTVINKSGVLDSGLSAVSYALLTNVNDSIPAIVSTRVQNQTATAFTTGGTSAAFTLTPSPALTAYVAGKTRFNMTLNAAPTGSPTIAVSGLAAINAKYYDSTGTKQFITAAVTPINWVSDVIYDGTDFVWLNTLPAASIAKLASLPTLTATQSANAATITLGAFSADFRNATLTSGTPNTRTLSSNASLVLPSGATLGVPTVGTVSSITSAGTTVTLNTAPSAPIQIGDVFGGANIPTNTTVVSFGTYAGGVGTGTIVLSASVTTTATAATFTKPSRAMILAIDNAGTIETAVVNQSGGNNLDETGLISTTAVSAGSTANNVVYSTTARTNIPYKVVGFMDFANPTAGQYSVAVLNLATASGRELAAMWGLGIGQTHQNVLAQRVTALTYVNTKNRPIKISVQNSAISGPSVTINGLNTIATAANGGGTNSLSITEIIPPGASYSVTATTITLWTELS